jgi:AraC-like DNA-binding protein
MRQQAVGAHRAGHQHRVGASLLTISGLNPRRLQRLFRKHVGASPKWVIQRYRLHKAIARVQAGIAFSWKALALELGYFDQVHFVRDFRHMVGMSPGEYEKSLADVDGR